MKINSTLRKIFSAAIIVVLTLQLAVFAPLVSFAIIDPDPDPDPDPPPGDEGAPPPKPVKPPPGGGGEFTTDAPPDPDEPSSGGGTSPGGDSPAGSDGSSGSGQPGRGDGPGKDGGGDGDASDPATVGKVLRSIIFGRTAADKDLRTGTAFLIGEAVSGTLYVFYDSPAATFLDRWKFFLPSVRNIVYLHRPEKLVMKTNPPDVLYVSTPYQFTAMTLIPQNKDIVFWMEDDSGTEIFLPKGMSLVTGYEDDTDQEIIGNVSAKTRMNFNDGFSAAGYKPPGTIYGMDAENFDSLTEFTFTLCAKNKLDDAGLFVVREDFTLYFDKMKENYELFAVESADRARGLFNTYDFILEDVPDPGDEANTIKSGLVGGTETTVSVVKRVVGNRVVSESTDQYLHIDGGFEKFESLWIDGELMKRSESDNPALRDGDYYAEDGSTRVTVFDQTVSDLSDGDHTVSAAFVENSLEGVSDDAWESEYTRMDTAPGASDLGTASQNFTVTIDDSEVALAGEAASAADGSAVLLNAADVHGVTAADSGVGTPVTGARIGGPDIHPDKGFFHYRDSRTPLILSFDLPSDEFSELLFDSDKMEQGKDYAKTSRGDLTLDILPASLDTHDPGTHTLTAVFLGGTMDIEFTLDPGAGFFGGSAQAEPVSNGLPFTIILIAAAAAAIALVAVIQIRKKRAAQAVQAEE